MVKPGELLSHGQTIACLNENAYRTETGGVVYYSTGLSGNNKKRSTKQIFSGTIYWVPEETHKINSKGNSQSNRPIRSFEIAGRGLCIGFSVVVLL